MTDHSGHTTWCAQGHRCGLGEHRSTPHTVHLPGAGTAVLTRVLNANRQQYAEVRLRLVLDHNDATARQQLAAILTNLRALGRTKSRADRRAA